MKLLTMAEAGDRLGLSAVTLRLQARNGVLRATKVGRDWVVSEREVTRYAAEHRGRVGRPRHATSSSARSAK